MRNTPSKKLSPRQRGLATWLLVAPLVLAVSSFACTLLSPAATPTPLTAPTTSTDIPTRACTTAPLKEPPEDGYETTIEPLEVLAPSGNRIYGMMRRPDPTLYPDLCFSAVVLVPGGINPGRMAIHGKEAEQLARVGMVVVTFNAEGRIDTIAPEKDLRSEGTEDYNGFRHQDGLCEIVRHVIALPYVTPDNVGIATQSYGITMGAGCAGRYPDLPIKYLVDGEGPPDSFVTTHEPSTLDGDPSNDKVEVVYDILDHYSLSRDPSEENQAFWSEREAIRFIGAYRGRYLRLQATWDHAQPPWSEAEIPAFDQPPLWWHNKHTTDMVNTAVEGGVPWVQVNLARHGNSVNGTFDAQNPPVYLPGYLGDKPWAVWAILEMARMP
jgi:hypothetical protein